MRSIREIVAIFLAVVSLATVPLGIAGLIGGFGGRLVDAEYSLNIKVGVESFLIGLFPPIALFAWWRARRGEWQN